MEKKEHETHLKIDREKREAFLLAISVINTAHQMALASDICPACMFGAVLDLLDNIPDEVIEALHTQRGKEALEAALEKFVEDFETAGNA